MLIVLSFIMTLVSKLRGLVHGGTKKDPEKWTTDHLKRLDEIKFAHYLFGFDVAVISGHQEHYTLRHHYGIRGWQVEIIEPSVASNYSNVEEA